MKEPVAGAAVVEPKPLVLAAGVVLAWPPKLNDGVEVAAGVVEPNEGVDAAAFPPPNENPPAAGADVAGVVVCPPNEKVFPEAGVEDPKLGVVVEPNPNIHNSNINIATYIVSTCSCTEQLLC